ncbi:hypothetical protein G6O67_008439 [Ophiocordyceps sinensis]|uniref:Uncharacterized protein n=2 Tax=Ophiocordyceps sinensis TaxID=72228 RepID=A0A8H4PJL4_9HYPO|nr:hypothetical protein OCS_01840 [Ophiocordyceps sinensis CO18]KAF4504266.1 hypothetical protein G6O67_008439 [Ophiocordyceps sinensis]
MSSPRGDLRAPTLQCSHLFLTELCTFIPRVCCCIGASQPADTDAHIGVRLVAVDQSRRAAPPGPSAPGPSARAGSENARSNEAMARGCRVWPGDVVLGWAHELDLGHEICVSRDAPLGTSCRQRLLFFIV